MTDSTTVKTHSEGAIRAAGIIAKLYVNVTNEEITMLAETIDRETKCKELGKIISEMLGESQGSRFSLVQLADELYHTRRGLSLDLSSYAESFQLILSPSPPKKEEAADG